MVFGRRQSSLRTECGKRWEIYITFYMVNTQDRQAYTQVSRIRPCVG